MFVINYNNRQDVWFLFSYLHEKLVPTYIIGDQLKFTAILTVNNYIINYTFLKIIIYSVRLCIATFYYTHLHFNNVHILCLTGLKRFNNKIL